MAYSKVSISNLALASLGADSIRSFDEDNKRARMCDIFYDATRDYLLAKFDWPFARRFKKINEVSFTDGTVLPIGMRAFQLPDDCKTPRDIHPPGSRDSWAIYGNKLYTDKGGTIHLYFTAKEINVNLFSDTFANLLALGMAVRMCPVITQDKNLTKSLYQQYQIEQLDSWESDANIGEEYRAYDEDPNNDTFVHPDSVPHAEDASRFQEME